MSALPARYAAYARLRAPAMRRPALWRLALGAALVAAAWAAGGLGTIAAARWLLAGGDPAFLGELREADTARAVLTMLATFAALLAAPFAAARLLHGRRPPGLIGPARAAARDFGIAAAATGAAFAATMVPWALAYDSAPGLDPRAWALLLPLTALLLAVQTGAEEVAFRGYLQSQLAARFRSPLVWAALPSVLFGLVHYDAAMAGANAAALVGSATLFGLMAADLTARTGTLGAAWGVHFANNFGALALIGTPGSLSGLALRRAPYSVAEPLPGWLVAADLALIAAIWLVLARLLRRDAPPQEGPP